MRFAVDPWRPDYGSSDGLDPVDPTHPTDTTTDVEIERPIADWAAIPPDADLQPPSTVVFVDGVRRVEAQVWVDEQDDDGQLTGASMALCGSYAAGAVCCCADGAHLLNTQIKRGLFTTAAKAEPVRTGVGLYEVKSASLRPGQSPAQALSSAYQRHLTELEMVIVDNARSVIGEHCDADDDLLVIDGPLRGRETLEDGKRLERAIGYIKTHQTTYLPPAQHQLVSTLRPGERTPVFQIGDSSWERFSWYLRLPGELGSPWAGIVRIESRVAEAHPDQSRADAIVLACQSQVVLPRYASTGYKDARAPQNLYPIAGLERELRRRLGDQRLLYRSLRQAARVALTTDR